MITLLTIIILLACLVLAFFVLVQNPKGGGLTGNFGTMSSQVMGVKQSSDVMEKGTWVTIGIIGVLCIAMVMFIDKPANMQREQPAPKQQQSAPAPSGSPAGVAPATPAPAPAK